MTQRIVSGSCAPLLKIAEEENPCGYVNLQEKK
jgi:hypothetical protein